MNYTKCLEGVTMEKEIEKIYICKKRVNDSEIIEKFLIQYVDGSSSYTELPSSYNKLLKPKKLKEEIRIKEQLDKYIKKTQIPSNKIITVYDSDTELKEYVDYQTEKIYQDNLKELEQMRINSGSLAMAMSIFTDIINKVSLGANSFTNIGVLITTIISSKNFIDAVKHNKERKVSETELKYLKTLKLYFSYLMLSLNIMFGINNLKVNFEPMARDAKLVTLIMSRPMNILIDDDSKLMATTADARVAIFMEALDRNPMLNEEDREIALTLTEYVEENPYIDDLDLYITFTSLSVLHSKNYVNDNIIGMYQKNSNSIEMLNGSFKTEEKYEDTMQHEMIHATGYLDNLLLNEGITSLLQMEYTNDSTMNNAYYDHVLITRIFCELITPEKLLEAYTKEDMSIIEEEMLKLNPNKEDYELLIDEMQKYSENFEKEHWVFITNPTSSDENIPSYKFHKLFEPYLNSDKLSREAKEEIEYYISEIGYWVDVDAKMYFNKEINLTK